MNAGRIAALAEFRNETALEAAPAILRLIGPPGGGGGGVKAAAPTSNHVQSSIHYLDLYRSLGHIDPTRPVRRTRRTTPAGAVIHSPCAPAAPGSLVERRRRRVTRGGGGGGVGPATIVQTATREARRPDRGLSARALARMKRIQQRLLFAVETSPRARLTRHRFAASRIGAGLQSAYDPRHNRAQGAQSARRGPSSWHGRQRASACLQRPAWRRTGRLVALSALGQNRPRQRLGLAGGLPRARLRACAPPAPANTSLYPANIVPSGGGAFPAGLS